MANIKNLQMWNDICADARISISKSMLGLKTTATYIPTQRVRMTQEQMTEKMISELKLDEKHRRRTTG